MRWMRLFTSWLILTFVAPSLVLGQQPALSRVGLDDVLRLALHQNPTLRAQQFALESTKAGEITAGRGPNPTMNLLAEQFGGGSAHQTQSTVNVGQPIELGGKRQRRIDSALAATSVAGYQLEDLRQIGRASCRERVAISVV